MAPAQWERIACISLPSLKVDSSGAPAESGAWSQHVQALDLSGMGLICDSGLPSSLSALVGLSHLGLSNNPDLFGPIPSNWSALTRLSKCPVATAASALPALGPGDGSSDEFFYPTGFYCGLDVRDTGLCGGYPGDLALRSTPTELPPCAYACNTGALAGHSNSSATRYYLPLCAMMLGYVDVCLDKSKHAGMPALNVNVTNNFTLCPSPPPPSPPSPPSPPPADPGSSLVACVQKSDLSPVNDYMCAIAWCADPPGPPPSPFNFDLKIECI